MSSNGKDSETPSGPLLDVDTDVETPKLDGEQELVSTFDVTRKRPIDGERDNGDTAGSGDRGAGRSPAPKQRIFGESTMPETRPPSAIRRAMANAETMPVPPLVDGDSQHSNAGTEFVQRPAGATPTPRPGTGADLDEINHLVGRLLVERYQVVKLIGRGGMGSVFLGEHIAIRKPVAIKVLSSELAAWPVYVERFLQEAQAASKIRHRNVVDITDFGHTDEQQLPFFVMEFLNGEDLQATLSRDGPMAWTRARPIILQVCSALEAAHRNGIIHRDIKPDNCFLIPDSDMGEIVKVLDFGIAKQAFQDSASPLTSEGVVLGTVDYIAPERVLNQPVDRRADIYSLGILLYRMLTGRTPFQSDDAMAVVQGHIQDAPRPPREIVPDADIPAGVEAAVLKAIAKRPGDRFQTVQELANELKRFGHTGLSDDWLVTGLNVPDDDDETVTAVQERDATGTEQYEIERSGRSALGVVLGVLAVVIAFGAGGFAVWSYLDRSPAAASAAIDAERLDSFAPLPPVVTSHSNEITDEKVALGRALFHDRRLSLNHDIACSSCHDLARYGVDHLPVAQGHFGQLGLRNTPSVYNAAGQFSLMWDGRARTLEEQASMPLFDVREMGNTPDRVVSTLSQIPGYVPLFQRAFPHDDDPITLVNIGNAIASFERTLLTPGPWDRFLQGDQAALDAQQKQGFNLFVDLGCVTCHVGTYVGGTMYQKLGLIKAWRSSKDMGRYAVTNDESDRMVFKVPGLRNVAETAPYFHNGHTASLDEAVRLMAWHQLGRRLRQEQTTAIVAWLGSLTGEIPPDLATPPQLP